MSHIDKNEYQFSKRCEDYFGYVVPLKIKLNDQDDYGYCVSMKQSIKKTYSINQMLLVIWLII